MAGNGAYVKLEGFIFIPINAFCSAATTFVSQNIGAREYGRVKEGAAFAVGFSCVCAFVLGAVFYFLAPTLVGLFGKSAEAIAAGVLRGRICSVAYVLLAMSHGIAAVCRGAGYAKVPMYVMLGVWCVFRVAYIQVVLHLFRSIALVFLAYPITWAVSSVIFLWYYRRSRWLERIRAQDYPLTD